MPSHALSWLEISESALRHNVATFVQLAQGRPLMAVVKANAYGHGALEVARWSLAEGARWLAVFHIDEALALRQAGLDAPLLVLGPTPRNALREAAQHALRVTVAGVEAVQDIVEEQPRGLLVHLKVETGTHRQGFMAADLQQVRQLSAVPDVRVEGVYSHFADIEDTTDHSYAMRQLEAFEQHLAQLASWGLHPPLRHSACSAAALLLPQTLYDLVRAGIGLYGLWPSKETLVSVRQSGHAPVELRPVLSWKTRVAQVKEVPAGASVAYGRTFKTTRPSRLAVLPVGYANGYDRALSARAHVLVRGHQAKLCGRVMMNMTVVDVTDIAGAAANDEVVLLGRQGEEVLSAELLASWAGTINYEVVTRAEPGGVRLTVP